MRLYILRHGKAQAESPTGRDADRPLRRRGERQARWIGEHLVADPGRPEVIYSSELRRAVETARLVGEALDCEVREEPVLGLGHGASDVVEILQLIARADEIRSLMLVGHNPQLETLVGVLVGGPAGAPVRLRTGECAVLEAPSPEEPVGESRLVATLRLVED